MTTLTPIALSFRSGLHIGAKGVDLAESRPTIPSDTLFSALVDVLRRLSGSATEVEAFLQPFVSAPPNPPFRITSAFPLAGDVRFYPVPRDLMRRFKGSAQVEERGKAVKRIAFMSEALFKGMLAREPLDDWLYPSGEHDEPQRGVALQGGELWLTVDEIAQLPKAMQPKRDKRHALRQRRVWAQAEVARVTVNRIAPAGGIFHAGRVSFAPECGLWFGVAWRDDARRPQFNDILARLAHDGIGGERTTGYGAFEPKPGAPFDLPDAQPGGGAFLLSRYHPRNDELPEALGEGAAYALESIGGWLRSPDGAAQRRKRVTMVAEGSVVRVPADSSVPMGDVVNVCPEYADEPKLHPVYRYGLALTAGLQR